MGNQRETQGNGASALLALLSQFCKDHKERVIKWYKVHKERVIKWYKILFVSSRAIALALDPLFFFVPVIHEDKKCISEDKKMWINAIFWRSFLDFKYLVHFVVKFYIEKNEVELSLKTPGADESKGQRCKFWNFSQEEKELWKLRMWFMFDIIVIFPFPQVLMSNILSEMRRAEYTNYVTILNAVILIQYVPRVLQIYLSLKKLDEHKNIPIPIRASFNFFLYVLAGYVFGAFWYFFSTQRLTYCWRKACLHHGECVQGSFSCDHSFGNLSVSHDFCSIDSTNTRTFDFGIFLEARRSGILESTDFPKKLIYTAWWGLRNLSSFGSNLQTSTYIWENAFAYGFSMFGLLLFLYFLGNLQVYMQDSASESIKISKAGKLLRKLGQLYKKRASESIENSEKDKNLALDDANFDKLVTELEQLYKQYIASKSGKDAVQKSDVGNLLIKLAEIYKQPASTSIENSETDKNVVEKLGKELGQLYKQCKDAVQPKSDGAVVEAASISEPV
ncbi:cyclic nucleotide-gated ion channel 1-like isoform X2 [Quercus lobata]|uniref:cyclic nucleotide-gated ion channel 1-like isoform X2 n=1 Tax=Quercus lobata TaxID=97700 RepID=UPI00124825F7|nr:cyclic nucleotide-gated ion channel 1-like isoform X2 [Quercus lobata]